jgi:hypothetical protein
MSDINKEYIKTLSKIVEKIKKLQEQVKDISDIEKNLSFKNVVNSLEEFRKNIDVLKIVIDEELRTKTLKFENSLANLEGNISDTINKLKKEIEEIKFIWEKDEELGYKIQKSLSEVIKEIKEELDNLKETLRKYAEELKFTKEGLLKSPGIIGPSASGIEVLLNNQKKGVYSKLNFIEGANITFEISENKQEGRANIKINSTGGGGGGGSITFLQLTDTPSSYSGHSLKLVQVNSNEDALQFTPISSLITAGNGISLSGITNVTITNTGILSLNDGPGISITEGQNPTISNTGVLSLNNVTGNLTLQGTSNQINVTTTGTTITLSTPQDIDTEAAPTFAGLTLRRTWSGNILNVRDIANTTDVFSVTTEGYLFASGTGTFNTSPLTIGNLVLSDTDLTLPRTFTFPDVSDTLVSETATQTLTNKTLGDGSTWQGNVISTQYGGTGLSSIGNANQILGVNSEGTGLEYKNIASLLTAGTGISITGTTNATIANTGILSLTAGPGILISSGQNPTITNTGVLSLNSATGTLILQGTTNQVNINTSGNTITLSLPQNIHTQATPIFAGLTLKRSTAGNVFVIRNTSDTSDTFVINDAGVITSGTWQGTTIGISYGGTGATTASQARTNLGAAASGINTDITAIRGLNQQNAIQINPYGTASGNTGEIRFLELAANGTNYVGFKAPDNIASNIIWTLPNSDGTSGQVLTTNGSGVLSWTTVSGGGGGGGYTTIQEEGTPLTQRAIMNFIGAGLTAQDDATNLRTNIIWDRFLAERKAPFYYTDFLGPAGATTVEPAYPFDFVAISSGTIAKIPGEPNHPGILRISSSTTANSGGYVLTDITAFRISGGEVFEIIFQPRVSGNANTTIRMGFLDTTSSTDATDGVYFELPANSLDIVGKTANNGVRTTSTTIATLTVNTWYRCRIEINDNATQANFYVYNDNGTLLGSTSITTNIPTALGRETGAGFVATNSGTTATLLAYFDFMAVGYNGRELTR